MAEILIGYIGLFIALLSIGIVIWDHFKDDRLLTKRVQFFYESIENLIFSRYKMSNFRNQVKDLKILDEDSLRELKFYEIQNRVYRAKMIRNIDENANYIGLFYEGGRDKFYNDFFIEGINYTLENTGFLYEHIHSASKELREARVFYHPKEEKTIILKKEIEIINKFLANLRDYWKEYYYKIPFRKKLKPKLDFNELLTI